MLTGHHTTCFMSYILCYAVRQVTRIGHLHCITYNTLKTMESEEEVRREPSHSHQIGMTAASTCARITSRVIDQACVYPMANARPSGEEGSGHQEQEVGESTGAVDVTGWRGVMQRGAGEEPHGSVLTGRMKRLALT